MKILYIFPHPDDESFGPAPAIAKQRREGHEVYLLTLTRGEATKQRKRLGVGKKEMGEIRYNEMLCVKEVLDLNGMSVLDFPDSGLKELNPIDIEDRIKAHIQKIQPEVVVTYAVHGISGFEDHLVAHAVVKRVFSELRDNQSPYPKRLALFTRYSENDDYEGKFDLTSSKKDDIDCWESAGEEDMEKFRQALDCYETYQKVIEESGVKDEVSGEVPFEIFREDFDPPLNGLTERLPD